MKMKQSSSENDLKFKKSSFHDIDLGTEYDRRLVIKLFENNEEQLRELRLAINRTNDELEKLNAQQQQVIEFHTLEKLDRAFDDLLFYGRFLLPAFIGALFCRFLSR